MTCYDKPNTIYIYLPKTLTYSELWPYSVLLTFLEGLIPYTTMSSRYPRNMPQQPYQKKGWGNLGFIVVYPCRLLILTLAPFCYLVVLFCLQLFPLYCSWLCSYSILLQIELLTWVFNSSHLVGLQLFIKKNPSIKAVHWRSEPYNDIGPYIMEILNNITDPLYTLNYR